MDFKGKTVIISGGSDGVGAATARAFARDGANLVLAARGKKKLEAIANELRERTRVEFMAMDVADEDACARLLKKAQFEFGSVHVLVNNAGYHARGLVENVGADDLGRMIDVNLRAPIILSRLAIPFIRESGGGAIINVGSLAGRAAVAGIAGYGASKAGLRAFTYALAEELSEQNIKVAVVSPGPIDTAFIMENLDVVTDVNLSQPISTASEVADVILRLCSNWKTEQVMPPASGLLTTIVTLFPWLRRIIRPMLERKGHAVKLELKRKLHQQVREHTE